FSSCIRIANLRTSGPADDERPYSHRLNSIRTISSGMNGSYFALFPFVKWTVFSIVVVGFGVFGLANPQWSFDRTRSSTPPAAELKFRSDALARAKVFRRERFDAAKVDFSTDPN